MLIAIYIVCFTIYVVLLYYLASIKSEVKEINELLQKVVKHDNS